jgi:hypothetical protein
MVKKQQKIGSQKRFCKELLTPIPLAPPPRRLKKKGAVASLYPESIAENASAIAAWRSEANTTISSQTLAKLELLLQHYEIPKGNPDCWFYLAINLAHQFLPGFSIAKKAGCGRPKIWNDELLTRLYLVVEERKALARDGKKPVSLKKISFELSKVEPWKSIPKCTDRTLYDRYEAAQKMPIVKALDKLNSMPAFNEFTALIKQAYCE